MAAGDIAWVLMSSALVLFMTPGLALFYGGMVRAKNVLNMLMMNFFTISIVTVVWVAVGYSIVFGVRAAASSAPSAMPASPVWRARTCCLPCSSSRLRSSRLRSSRALLPAG